MLASGPDSNDYWPESQLPALGSMQGEVLRAAWRQAKAYLSLWSPLLEAREEETIPENKS